MNFIKMHGIGNDYVYIDGFHESIPDDPAALAIAVSQPHTAIGSDGLILILPCAGADAQMRIFNKDGSEATMCGNGIRCVAKYLYDSGIARKEALVIDTLSGQKRVWPQIEDGVCIGARVDMGIPSFDPAVIPVNSGSNVVEIQRANGQPLSYTCVHTGNTQAVTFDLDPAEATAADGALAEHAPCFPNRANICFVRVDTPDHLTVRVWERGSAFTEACGTGACASLVAACVTGRIGRRATVQLPGGELFVEWSAADWHVYMTGPATISFLGQWTNRL